MEGIDIGEAVRAFHFLRPWWLIAVPILLFLWLRIRIQSRMGLPASAQIAPHLVKALTVGGMAERRFLPIDAMAAAALLIVLGAAGPTWSRAPNPLAAQTAPLSIVVKVTESMLERDVQPNRLERAKQKVLDIAAEQVGGRSALIAYAGTAHRVVPLTEDTGILKPFVEGLAPDIMPATGENASAALRVAHAALEAETSPGSILFVIDRMNAADLQALAQHAAVSEHQLIFLVIGTEPATADVLNQIGDVEVVLSTHDDQDVSRISSLVASAYRDALSKDDRLRWDDKGWLFTLPAALLVLLCFRQGWTMRWALALALFVAVQSPRPAVADGLADWFLTADQQGRLAFERKEYATAAARFQDPYWIGYVLTLSGKYLEAARVFDRLDGADAAFAKGYALIKGRQYREGIASFENALALDPDHKAAARNLEISRQILSYLERTRAQSDTQEGSEGADEVIFDAGSDAGVETTISGGDKLKVESAAQWMRSVDTRTGDFLKLRFAQEAAQRPAESD